MVERPSHYIDFARVAQAGVHHVPGGFANPWPDAAGPRGFREVMRWRRERRVTGVAPDPAPGEIPIHPHALVERAGPQELRLTWVGHATFVIQVAGFNLLTDPMWSLRASPITWAGPKRIVPAAVPFDELPAIDAVLLSHDHYDHLDRPTIARLISRYGDALEWIVPPGHAAWLRARGAHRVTEIDWWEHHEIRRSGAAPLRITALPAQHWTRRTPWQGRERLWSSYAVESAAGPRLYFAGDSGYSPAYRQIGAADPRFDAVILPIGAYAPRWFMRTMHMDPTEAVQAYRELGGSGLFTGMHWGTFRLADEPPTEPPLLTAEAWAAAGLPARNLWVPRHGETRTILLDE